MGTINIKGYKKLAKVSREPRVDLAEVDKPKNRKERRALEADRKAFEKQFRKRTT